MHLEVTHETRYDYLPPVEVAQHMAYLRPWNTVAQELLRHDLQVEPRPAQQTEAVDVYGNHRTFIALQTPHAQLRVVARSTLRTHTRPMPASTVAWEQVRERFRYRADAVYDPAAEFVFASQHVPRSTEFAAYARPSFPAGVSMLDGALDLMHRIHAEFTYDNRSTQINTPAQQALAQRKGVCQDFAHIMIAGLRSMGLAARYVSGYLLTEPPPGQPRLTGADASHAWAQVYLPDLPGAGEGAGWYDLDPTNNRHGWGTPGEDYVTLAIGRDYADISPIRGVIHGGARHTLSVAVTVAPVDEGAPEVLAASAAAETDRAESGLTSIPEDQT